MVEVLEDRVRIDHEEIRGFMEAMTMSFEVKDPSLLQGIERGMKVSFQLEVAERSVVLTAIEPSARP